MVGKTNKYDKLDINSTLPPELNIPAGAPIFRRDGKDVIEVKQAILEEIVRQNRDEGGVDAELLVQFAKGCWRAFVSMSILQHKDFQLSCSPYPIPPNQWDEVNLCNVSLYPNFIFKAPREFFRGRLFTSHMPTYFKNHRDLVEKFQLKVIAHSLRCVLIITTDEESEKTFGTELENFYRAMQLQVLHRVVPSPLKINDAEITSDIQDIIYMLIQGVNCLVQCKNGNGLSGMIAACVVKAVGVQASLPYIRRFNTKYVENPTQEAFVNAFSTTLNDRVAMQYPELVKAVAADILLQRFLRVGRLILVPEHVIPEKFTINYDVANAFNVIDIERTGFLTARGIQELFATVHPSFYQDICQQFILPPEIAPASPVLVSKRQLCYMLVDRETQA